MECAAVEHVADHLRIGDIISVTKDVAREITSLDSCLVSALKVDNNQADLVGLPQVPLVDNCDPENFFADGDEDRLGVNDGTLNGDVFLKIIRDSSGKAKTIPTAAAAGSKLNHLHLTATMRNAVELNMAAGQCLLDSKPLAAQM